ncbi:MAG: nucleoside triphosphate pyrophosphohydrolase [Ruminococcaceae bacterium]|jgi:tetrapyrrole methylase family protein/MazG family protein|nr:nucleoside triphosphate pyrophosphohydrolase [Oscillospiraceae bacterium]
MSVEFNFKEKYTIDDLLRIMEILRSDEGCPWDREQDHKSIKSSLIEETYEVIEAINKDDSVLMCEELGDVLLQVVFHSQLAKEEKAFSFEDVCDGVCKKMIERHPHVFGNVEVKDSSEVLVNWEEIKSRSKNRKSVSEKMLSIPRELPALMRSAKIQDKARKAGFDWDSADGAFQKVREEADELEKAVRENSNIEEELGDLLFSVVNVSRFLGVDAEEALTKSADKFTDRFILVEKLAAERGIDMQSSSIDELDKLWDEVKKQSN